MYTEQHVFTCTYINKHNYQLLLASCYIDSGQTSQKTRPLPSNGYMQTIQKTLLPLLLYLQLWCIEMEVIQLLPAYLLSRECVYQIVAWKWVYMSQYLFNHEKAILSSKGLGSDMCTSFYPTITNPMYIQQLTELNLHVQHYNTVLFKKSILDMCISLYNKDLDQIKLSENFNLFKKDLKSFLLHHSFY
jgi:hypothetical protein